MTVIAGALTFLLILAVAALVYLPVYRQYYDTYEVRIRPDVRNRKTPELQESSQSQILDICARIGDFVLALLPGAGDARSVVLLTQANFRTRKHLSSFIGIKAIAAGATGILFLLGSGGNPMALLLTVPGCLCAWSVPNFHLSVAAKRRQKTILAELPTVLDLMIVCAQAGLGLLMCIDKVSKEVADTCPHLSSELQQMLQDVKVFATSTAVALSNMGERCGVEELSSVASALVACEVKGSDISYPLKQQSLALRDRIKRRKEEEASKTPVKMVPVIMIFIMPLILCPMLGPAVIIIIEALSPVFGSKPN